MTVQQGPNERGAGAYSGYVRTPNDRNAAAGLFQHSRPSGVCSRRLKMVVQQGPKE